VTVGRRPDPRGTNKGDGGVSTVSFADAYGNEGRLAPKRRLQTYDIGVGDRSACDRRNEVSHMRVVVPAVELNRKPGGSPAMDRQAQCVACMPWNDEGSSTSEGARQLKAAAVGADRGAAAGAGA
jgi:hypothetical protein